MISKPRNLVSAAAAIAWRPGRNWRTILAAASALMVVGAAHAQTQPDYIHRGDEPLSDLAAASLNKTLTASDPGAKITTTILTSTLQCNDPTYKSVLDRTTAYLPNCTTAQSLACGKTFLMTVISRTGGTPPSTSEKFYSLPTANANQKGHVFYFPAVPGATPPRVEMAVCGLVR